MKALAWMFVGLAAGLLVPAVVAQSYQYFYRSEKILGKYDDVRLGYVAGAFDVLQTVVKLSNKDPQQWTRAQWTRTFRCMEKQAGGESEQLLKWAERLWRDNSSRVASDAMFLAACVHSQ